MHEITKQYLDSCAKEYICLLFEQTVFSTSHLYLVQMRKNTQVKDFAYFEEEIQRLLNEKWYHKVFLNRCLKSGVANAIESSGN